jgi:hypothetical protein
VLWNSRLICNNHDVIAAQAGIHAEANPRLPFAETQHGFRPAPE